MAGYDSIVNELSKWIDDKRLKHSYGVSECAAKLAEHYGADADKARLAGLIHDCAKNLPDQEALRLCKKYHFQPDAISCMNKALLHAPLGALLAQEIFGIHDREILDAIACHTTGKKGMSLFEKIICLADYIEEGRRYEGVDNIRSLAFKDINKALLTAFELSIRNVLDRGKLLHPMTVESRNAILLEIENEDKSRQLASLKNQQPIES
ncbi:MAG TPA: HD domain-containing protein [Clostridiales bacterium]|nr:HD domain-containing protein [Clostridiales bacterium]